MEVTPVLAARAPRYIYVLGEVLLPGRYTMEGPTTVMQAIALGGSWRPGGNMRQVVVFRRGDDWRLMATMLDLQGALYGKRPCPADEIWLNDSDVVVVPKSPIIWADEFIEQVFTRGIYGVIPFQGVALNYTRATGL
jgi:polysaccharide export outer membrane protein